MIRENLKQQRNIRNQAGKLLRSGEGLQEEHSDEESELSEGQVIKAQKEAKIQMRMELEFEKLDHQKKDIYDVEEMNMVERKVLRGYKSKQDEGFTSAHIKAGRKILQAMHRLRNKKLEREKSAAIKEEARLSAPIEVDHIAPTFPELPLNDIIEEEEKVLDDSP